MKFKEDAKLIKTMIPCLPNNLPEIIAEYMPNFGDEYKSFDLSPHYCCSYSIGPDGLCYSIYCDHRKVFCHDRNGNIIREFEYSAEESEDQDDVFEEWEYDTTIHCSPIIDTEGLYYIYFFNFEANAFTIFTSNGKLLKNIQIHLNLLRLEGVGTDGNLYFMINGEVRKYAVLNPIGKFLFFSLIPIGKKDYVKGELAWDKNGKLYLPAALKSQGLEDTLCVINQNKSDEIIIMSSLGHHQYELAEWWYGPKFYNGRAYEQ